jgi:hypothetical protein
MLPSFWNLKITVLRAGTVAGRGSDIRSDWSSPTSHVVEGCWYSPGATAEDLDHREATSIDYVLRLPEDADIRSTDRVRLYVGEHDPEEPDFSIVGRVIRVPSPSGGMNHKKVKLIVWEG